MFIINGKSEDDYPKVKEYIQEGVAKIRSVKENVFFDDARLGKVKIKTTKGEEVAISSFRIPLRETVTIKDLGTYTIAYCNGQPKIDANGNMTLPGGRRKQFLQETLILYTGDKNAELIFFLRNFSSFIKNQLIIERDERKNYDDKNKKYTLANEVEYLIRSGNSPIAPDNDKGANMRFIARTWGIPAVEDMYINELRDKLLLAVQASEKDIVNTQRGYEEFISNVQKISTTIDDDMKMRFDIQKALEKNILTYIDKEWRIVLFPGKDYEKQLLKVKPSDEPIWISKLINEFKMNRGKYDLMIAELYPHDEEESQDKGEEELEEIIAMINDPKTPYLRLQKLCKNANPPIEIEGKSDDLRARLRERYAH